MITPRQRVLKALNFEPTDRPPKDLGGMRSTSISAFSYSSLAAALGLPPRLPRVADTGQMLALPDLDVLDALNCDVVTIWDNVSNAFVDEQQWHSYDFNGRLPALVCDPAAFRNQPDGTVLQDSRSMPPSSYVFDEEHGGQPLNLSDDLPMYDLKEYAASLAERAPSDEKIVAIRELCRRVRESTDRAVFFNNGVIQAPICIHGHGGLAVFPVICLTEPDYVMELHEIITAQAIKNLRAVMPEIRSYVDVAMLAADDWGTQQSTIASPDVFRRLFLPYRRRINDECHRLAPDTKTFLHSCGAIYEILDLIIDSGFDIVNPVQWPAGGHSFREWKDKARKRITLWGGGVNSQHTLPLGSVAAVEHETAEVVRCLAQDGGYVFCNIHNLVAEIPPDKVIALYRAAQAR
jgi:uroporphyrinogen decarboxylase